MGTIVNDIVEEIEIKPNKTKRVIRIIAGIASSLIVVAFAFGQFKSSFFNRMDKFEETLNNNTVAITSLETKSNNNFVELTKRIDKSYDDGLAMFNDFQVYNNKQLELIIDYGDSNKDMLKRMLEINSLEKNRTVENRVEQAKQETPTYNPEINVRGIGEQPESKEFNDETFFIDAETNDTTFYIIGATQKYIDDINKNKYVVGAITESTKYPDKYDVTYRNKK